MAAAESVPASLVFNGDFNWFNVDNSGFVEINRRVLSHQAILGNVEAEFGTNTDDGGCGCAYPEHVEGIGVVHGDALAIPYDQDAWLSHFLTNWPAGLDAWLSYFQRIRIGPAYRIDDAAPKATLTSPYAENL